MTTKSGRCWRTCSQIAFCSTPGAGTGSSSSSKPCILRALLHDRQQFLAERAVVVDDGDLLALELVPAAFLLGDVLQHGVAGHPVVADEREVPLEDAAVGGVAAAVARGDHRDLVGRDLVGQREGDAGGQRLEHRGAAVLALQALVALDAAVGGVGGLALLDQRHHAVDAAAGVDQLHVVVVPVGPRRGIGRDGAGAARQHREELLLGLGMGRGRGEQGAGTGGCQRGAEGDGSELHVCLQRWYSKECTRQCPRIDRPVGHPNARIQCGNGHSRSFSLAVDHSRARPCGSTIRKKTIRPPKIINSAWAMSAVPMVTPNKFAERRQRLVQEDRQHDDEGGAEEAAHDRAQAADDDHEQQLEASGRWRTPPAPTNPGARSPTARRPRRR